ncbi:hypothetical protein [Cognatishimia sp. F0-27]|uniref:hypothetical protein n=1 Tax=Cognatishimia sp. F0-27 TaxID=2816855 RepID=UPI001D0CD444|nr:hypothetical protein [Cognatishimia sp. F0-27]MCC1495134.1 hypothetical protein [Cognatishimia sp. F0-27]
MLEVLTDLAEYAKLHDLKATEEYTAMAQRVCEADLAESDSVENGVQRDGLRNLNR